MTERTSFYCDEHTSKGEECDDNDEKFHYSHSRLITQSNVIGRRHVDAQLSSDESIILQDSPGGNGVATLAMAL